MIPVPVLNFPDRGMAAIATPGTPIGDFLDGAFTWADNPRGAAADVLNVLYGTQTVAIDQPATAAEIAGLFAVPLVAAGLALCSPKAVSVKPRRVFRPPHVVPIRRRRGVGDLSSLLAPVDGVISSWFGPRTQPVAGASTYHQGIDYAVPVGTPVYAAMSGRVTFAGVQSGFGNTIMIDDGSGDVTTYGHLSQISVSVGQTVSAGDFIGLSGATGTVSGPNLHFQVAVNGQTVDPLGYLNASPVPSGDASSYSFDSSSDGSTSFDLSSIDPMYIFGGALLAGFLLLGRRS